VKDAQQGFKELVTYTAGKDYTLYKEAILKMELSSRMVKRRLIHRKALNSLAHNAVISNVSNLNSSTNSHMAEDLMIIRSGTPISEIQEKELPSPAEFKNEGNVLLLPYYQEISETPKEAEVSIGSGYTKEDVALLSQITRARTHSERKHHHMINPHNRYLLMQKQKEETQNKIEEMQKMRKMSKKEREEHEREQMEAKFDI